MQLSLQFLELCGFLPIGRIIVFVDKMPYVRAFLAFSQWVVCIGLTSTDCACQRIPLNAKSFSIFLYLNYIDVWLGCIQGNIRINTMKNSACVSIATISHSVWLIYAHIPWRVTRFPNQPIWQNISLGELISVANGNMANATAHTHTNMPFHYDHA